MKSALLALVLAAAFSAPALAGPCDTDLGAARAQLAGPGLDPDVKAEVEDMLAQAEKLCAAGNEMEAADVISDATAMIAAQ